MSDLSRFLAEKRKKGREEPSKEVGLRKARHSASFLF